MNSQKNIHWLAGWAAGAALLALTTGCQPKTEPQHANGELFDDDVAEHALQEFANRQAANSTRMDSTFREYHFDGGRLNTLGEERVDQLLYRREQSSPLVIYMDMSETSDDYTKRQQTVTAFLKDRGLNEAQFQFKHGANPNWNSPVASMFPASSASPAQGPAAAPAAAAPSGAAAAH